MRLMLQPVPGVGQAAIRSEPLSSSGVGPSRADRRGDAPGQSLRARRQPSQRITYAPDPTRLQESERATVRQARRELHEAQRARVEALTASLLTRPDNQFTTSEAAAVATVGTATAADFASGRIASRTVTDTDGTVLATLTADGWTDRWGGIVGDVEAVPVGLTDHRCAGSSTTRTIIRFSDRPDLARCTACGGGTFRSDW